MRFLTFFFTFVHEDWHFYHKSKSKFIFDQKNRARFLSRTISCVIFSSCTNREIVDEFFVISNPVLDLVREELVDTCCWKNDELESFKLENPTWNRKELSWKATIEVEKVNKSCGVNLIYERSAWNFLMKAMLCIVEIASKDLMVSEVKVDGQWSWG